ncbi:hypothetical protein OH787_06105 [Streptomyces sp. NBC_01547]|uniref:hypothetical protein n=1 Tax=Streptomyces sp. NBC_01547 TaxID=2975873 RepID=UPI00386E744A
MLTAKISYQLAGGAGDRAHQLVRSTVITFSAGHFSQYGLCQQSDLDLLTRSVVEGGQAEPDPFGGTPGPCSVAKTQFESRQVRCEPSLGRVQLVACDVLCSQRDGC